MALPIFGRLSFADWQRIAITFLILALEQVLRVIVWVIPVSVIDWTRYHLVTYLISIVLLFIPVETYILAFSEDTVMRISRMTGTSLSVPGTLWNWPRLSINRMITRETFTSISGYDVEEHNIFTPDGYLLVLHRIVPKIEEIDADQHPRHSRGPGKPPVLMMHGCMMSSEVWICLRSAQKCLPFVLVDAGYDVWLGNVRGNKYCQNHRSLKPSQGEFWDFSLDELILQDLPTMIDYVLTESPGYTKLTYVGFSQGSTIGFATLSMRKDMNEKIGLMIGLAATTKPKGMKNRLVQALTRASPELIYLFFSRRIFIKMVVFWRELFSARAYTAAIDVCQKMLFGWESNHIRFLDKMIAYQHLYAFTSSKLIVQWFQIMRSKRLQMYDEGSPVTLGSGHVVPRYALEAITTKIALFLGGRDTLVDNEYTKKHLGSSVVHVTEVAEYEHLDFLWAHDVDTRIYPKIIQLINESTH